MLSTPFILASGFVSLAKTAFAKQAKCVADEIKKPAYFGTEVVNIEAKEVKGFVDWDPVATGMNIQFDEGPIDFCNVTVTYTHPGVNDNVNVYVWLPLQGWNGRFIGMGGGGWAAGYESSLVPAVANGYAGASTDAGHTFFKEFPEGDAHSWALLSPGNVNWALLQDFASIALDDFTNIAKQVTESFYGNAPKYSYWNGCSTGGRQGLMQAQRFPKNYDGIIAAAPAINWASFVISEYWGQLVMRRENYYPPPCELEAIRIAAVDACDDLDGVKDGVIAATGLCKFDAMSVVGQSFDCDGHRRKISRSAARIVNAAWEGPKRDGQSGWFGLAHGTILAGPRPFDGLLSTTCDSENNNCKPTPFPISEHWVQLFLAKDPQYDMGTMTEDDFWQFLHMSRQRYSSVIGTDDPDLSEFRAAGGKLITWHGLADQLIFPNGSFNYYERVLQLDPKARDFYRYFEVPGAAHCSGGEGAYPDKVLNAMVDWVEKSKAPVSLETTDQRLLCPYPEVAAYEGGDPSKQSSFKCRKNFGTKKASTEGHSEL